MTSVYVLCLEGGRYYVGSTDSNILSSYEDHVAGRVSSWTQLYPPKRIVAILFQAKEDTVVLDYMAIYGVDMVRGGSYQEIELSKETKMQLNYEVSRLKPLQLETPD
jgi:hypothetical protein